MAIAAECRHHIDGVIRSAFASLLIDGDYRLIVSAHAGGCCDRRADAILGDLRSALLGCYCDYAALRIVCSRASLRIFGSSLPRRSALRKMPSQARLLK